MSSETPSKQPQKPLQSDREPVNPPEPAFGWTPYAEQLNGRFAMIGFVILLVINFLSGQDFFSWLGLR